jgi:hypothetical protein
VIRSLQAFFLDFLLRDEISTPTSRRTTGDAPLGGEEVGSARLGIKEAVERLPFSIWVRREDRARCQKAAGEKLHL